MKNNWKNDSLFIQMIVLEASDMKGNITLLAHEQSLTILFAVSTFRFTIQT